MVETLVKTGETVVTPNTTAPSAPKDVTPQVAKVPEPPKPEGVKPGVPSTPDVKTEAQMVPLAALQEEREKRQQLQSELEKLRAPSQVPQQQAPVTDVRAEIEKLWENDPKKAVQAEILLGLSWLDSINTSIEDQLDSLSLKDSNFGNYRGQVRAYIKSLPLEQRSVPGIADLAYNVVRGQNVDDIIQRTKDELYRKFQAGELAGMVNPPAAGTFSQPPVSSGTTLTPEQVSVARAMGMSETEYAKYIKR